MEVALNVDCIADRETVAPVYANLIGIAILPFIFTILALLLWIVIKKIKKTITWKQWRKYTKGTIINSLFIIYPVMLKATIQMFACTSVEGIEYLDLYMNDECWVGDHYTYTICVAIPSLIIWGIGLPFSAFYMIYKKNKDRHLNKKSNMTVYGFLYLGYLPRKYWWEMVILGRKFTILMTIVWLNRVSVEIQALVALLIIVIANRMHYANMPYESKAVNEIEVWSLMVCFFTLYFGLWYLSGDIYSEEAKIILFALIILSNLCFLMKWVIAYIRHAAWAVSIVKRFKLEKKYVDCEELKELLPQSTVRGVKDMYDLRQQHVRDVVNGKLHYYAKKHSEEYIGDLMQYENDLVLQIGHDIVLEKQDEIEYVQKMAKMLNKADASREIGKDILHERRETEMQMKTQLEEDAREQWTIEQGKLDYSAVDNEDIDELVQSPVISKYVRELNDRHKEKLRATMASSPEEEKESIF